MSGPHSYILSLIEEINQLEVVATQEEQRQKFRALITDKAIPLDGRWQIFMSAPAVFKTTSRWIVHFKSLEKLGEDAVGADGLIYMVDKHETIYISDLYELLQIEADLIKDGEERAIDWMDHQEFKEVVDEFREEVLSMNLHCYRYDW